jgi:hypothetical protein
MSERKFLIHEVDETVDYKGLTTETELCKRFDAALEKRMKDCTPTRELIYILIYGE